MDMSEGIIARFGTMGISRASVLTGHVLGSTIQAMLGLAVVFGVAVAIGFRPDAVPVEWIAAFGVLAMITLALAWLSVALGLVSKNVEVASNLPHAPSAPAVPRQRLRPHRLDVGRPSLVRGVPPFTPSSRRCADCSWARRSTTAPSIPSPGTPSSRSSDTAGR